MSKSEGLDSEVRNENKMEPQNFTLAGAAELGAFVVHMAFGWFAARGFIAWAASLLLPSRDSVFADSGPCESDFVGEAASGFQVNETTLDASSGMIDKPSCARCALPIESPEAILQLVQR